MKSFLHVNKFDQFLFAIWSCQESYVFNSYPSKFHIFNYRYKRTCIWHSQSTLFLFTSVTQLGQSKFELPKIDDYLWTEENKNWPLHDT